MSQIWYHCIVLHLFSSTTLGTDQIPNRFDQLWPLNHYFHYEYQTTILQNTIETIDLNSSIGFQLKAKFSIGTIGRTEDGWHILQFELRTPQIHCNGKYRASILDQFGSSKEFYVLRNPSSGNFEYIFHYTNQPRALNNFQKSVVSLFQFQMKEDEARSETDSSGHCLVRYKRFESNDLIEKTKISCDSDPKTIRRRRSDDVLGTEIDSKRITNYAFKNHILDTVISEESHKIYTRFQDSLGIRIQSEELISFIEKSKDLMQTSFSGRSVNDWRTQLLSNSYRESDLLLEPEPQPDSRSLMQLLRDFRDSLSAQKLGTLESAKVFLKLLPAARSESNTNEIYKLLSVEGSFKKILPQILDILGYAQTMPSFRAVLKRFPWDKREFNDLIERYLWSISVAPNPNPDIVKGLFGKYGKVDKFPEKIRETYVLTLGSLAHNLGPNHSISKEIEDLLVENALRKGGIYLKALKNLRSPSTIATLLKVIRTGSKNDVILAFKALKMCSDPNEEVLKACRRAFFQLDRRYDSSARTLAIDLILDSSNSLENGTLTELLQFLRWNESAFEVKQYMFQQLQRVSNENPKISQRIKEFLAHNPTVNNYEVLAPRGLSTALKRDFLSTPECRGSLTTLQEMFNGIVKRGVVNVEVEKYENHSELFSLGIFAGGLSHFIGTTEDSNDGEDDEPAVTTAGMDLTVFGNQLRPFVFFEGQGELMGHLWSGTASELTPAYQALILLQDHEQYLRLGSGYVLDLKQTGALSFDLSGQIQVSIWNRNAQSLVQKTAALQLVTTAKLRSSYVESQVEFEANLEPKLRLQSDIDFASGTQVCMRLSQQETAFREQVEKYVRIPNTKFETVKTDRKETHIPGTTYYLNRKTNDMCNNMNLE